MFTDRGNNRNVVLCIRGIQQGIETSSPRRYFYKKRTVQENKNQISVCDNHLSLTNLKIVNNLPGIKKTVTNIPVPLYRILVLLLLSWILPINVRTPPAIRAATPTTMAKSLNSVSNCFVESFERR